MRFLHTMIRVGNLDRSLDFYTRVLGMKLLRSTERPEQRYSLAFVGYGDERDTAVLELYDYQTDPEETKNFAADKPEVVAELLALLAQQPEAKPQVRSGAQPGAKKSGANPKQDRAAMFDKRDKDGDGKLTREEFLTGQPDPAEAPKRFIAFDSDKDGSVNREEFITAGRAKK